MRLYALHSLASVSPDLDLSIVTTSVAPALFIEANAREQSCGVCSAHHTWLLQSLSNIGWMPEHNLLWRHRRESQIVCALRPSDVNNAICRPVCRKKIFLPLDVIDANPMVVR
jgi:hypothetical protein